MIVRIYIDMIQ